MEKAEIVTIMVMIAKIHFLDDGDDNDHMKSILIYKIISKVYDLLDFFYFRKSDTSPRTSVNQYLGHKKLEILDICTGTAANAISIVKTNPAAKVTGIDISRDMLKIAEKSAEI